jgi:hypothetical protein
MPTPGTKVSGRRDRCFLFVSSFHKAISEKGASFMENNVVWLGLVVILALGAMVAQFVINVRNKRREKTPQ